MALTHPISPRVATLALSLRADLAAAEVFAALDRAGVEGILLRGPVIARPLYAEGERAYADCDILVARERWQRAVAALRELGFAPATGLSLAQHWQRPGGGVEVDLHRRLWGVRRSPERLYAAFARHREVFPLEGRDVVGLDRPATALVIALHASQHGMVVARPIADLERALDRFDGAVWGGALELARECGAELAFRQGLTMLPAGRARLELLGLEPALSVQSVLRRRGVAVPDFLFEALTVRERLSLLRKRIGHGATSAAPQPAADVIAPHGRAAGLVAFPARAVRFVAAWRRAAREARALGERRAP